MPYAFVQDFERRRTHVRRYIATVYSAERAVHLGSTRKIDLDRLHILRAGTFLIMYNLVEASARGAIQGIHDHMNASGVRFGDLTLTMRREVVKGFKRNADIDKHANMLDVPVDLISASLDVEHHFSGNVDAKVIREVAKLYQFMEKTDERTTRKGADLLTIKSFRNDLAHGDKTYDEVGRAYTARDLLEIGIRASRYIEQILENVSDYLDKSGYRQSP